MFSFLYMYNVTMGLQDEGQLQKFTLLYLGPIFCLKQKDYNTNYNNFNHCFICMYVFFHIKEIA
jgi:hypothetical protein